MNDAVIGPDSRVTLHFALRLTDGGVVDSTFERAPASFTMGDGNLLPGFEKYLLGLRVGAKESFRVPPEDAFGQPNPANVQRVPRSSFAADIELAEGLVVSFADASRTELPGVVQAFDDADVTVDFNHPLAGAILRFDVEIVAVEERHE